MPRIFVAIPVPAHVGSALSALIGPLVPGLRRVGPEQLHFTLAFVGPLGEERVAEVTSAVEAAGRGSDPFLVAFDAVGTFPPAGRAKVVWAGSSAAGADIARLGARVRAELERRAAPFDPKPLQPHVTLARVRDGATGADARAIAAAVAAAELPGGLAFRAEAVHVMESTLSRTGPRYSSRARIPLGPPG